MQIHSQNIDFKSVGIKPSDIDKFSILRNRNTHLVCRLECRQGSYILKWFDSPCDNKEIQVYSLLEKYEVDTLRVYERTERALLLEDLNSSEYWRLADQFDIGESETGTAIANWYLKLHQVGQSAIRALSGPKAFLHPWVNIISRNSLIFAADVFDLKGQRIWDLVLGSSEILKKKYRKLPQTFNYNDFAAENLALSRSKDHPLRAVIFDYDQFATGLVYSDIRNVISSLSGEAAAAFEITYGPVVEEERILDQPLAILHGLIIASRRENKPAWVEPLLESISSGDIEAGINLALRI